MLWAGEKKRSVLGCFGSGKSRLQLGAWGKACVVRKSLYQYFVENTDAWTEARCRHSAVAYLRMPSGG